MTFDITQRDCDLSVGATSAVPLLKPATIAIGRTEKSKSVYRMTLLNKIVEDSIRQSKLLAQMSEISYGTRQTRSSFTNNDLKEKPITDIPAVVSLTSEVINQYKLEEEEQNRYVDPKSVNEFLNSHQLVQRQLCRPRV
jgi:hypothetical protein